MKCIYKYPIASTVKMPKGARVVHFEKQPSRGNGVFLWAEVDTAQALENRHFYVFGTGQEVFGDYVSTFLENCGDFVWHLYETKNVL